MERERRSDILDIVENWLGGAQVDEGLERAVVRNQAPFLVQYLFRRQLEAAGAMPHSGTARPKEVQRLASAVKSLLGSAMGKGRKTSERHSDTDTALLLFLSFQPNSTRAQIPVAAELLRRGVTPRFLIAPSDFASEALLRAASLAYESHPSLPSPSTLRLALTTYFSTSKALLSRERSLALFRDVGLVPTTREAHALKVCLRKELFLASVRGATIYSAIRNVQSARGVVFSTHRAFLDELLPSILPRAQRFLLLQGIIPTQPRISTELHVDAAFAGSEVERPYLEDCGVPPEKVFVVGYPDYDQFVKLNHGNCRKSIATRLPQIAERKLAVFASQYATTLFPERARLINLEIVRECAKKSPDMFFIVKLHPRRETWSPGSLPQNMVVEKATDTFELLTGADVVITFWSTTALEALIVGTPLVQLNGTDLPNLFDISTRIPRPTARDAPELIQLIHEATSDEGRKAQEAAQRALSIEQDGRAAVRVANVLISKLEASPR